MWPSYVTPTEVAFSLSTGHCSIGSSVFSPPLLFIATAIQPDKTATLKCVKWLALTCPAANKKSEYKTVKKSCRTWDFSPTFWETFMINNSVIQLWREDVGVRRVEEGGREREREREEWGGVERGEVVANERERKKKNWGGREVTMLVCGHPQFHTGYKQGRDRMLPLPVFSSAEAQATPFCFFPPSHANTLTHIRHDMRGEEWLSSHQTVFPGKMESLRSCGWTQLT